jgi:hypothetical protein
MGLTNGGTVCGREEGQIGALLIFDFTSPRNAFRMHSSHTSHQTLPRQPPTSAPPSSQRNGPTRVDVGRLVRRSSSSSGWPHSNHIITPPPNGSVSATSGKKKDAIRHRGEDLLLVVGWLMGRRSTCGAGRQLPASFYFHLQFCCCRHPHPMLLHSNFSAPISCFQRQRARGSNRSTRTSLLMEH